MSKLRPNTETEAQFAAAAQAAGWDVAKRGWPDFAMWHPEKGFAVVEVKPSGRCKLKADQVRVLRALAAAGVKTFAWDPDRGFQAVDQE